MKKSKKKYRVLFPVLLIILVVILSFLALVIYGIESRDKNQAADFVTAKNNQLLLEGAVLTENDTAHQKITVRDKNGKLATVEYDKNTEVEVLFTSIEKDRKGNENEMVYVADKNNIEIADMNVESKLDILCNTAYVAEKVTYYKNLIK